MCVSVLELTTWHWRRSVALVKDEVTHLNIMLVILYFHTIVIGWVLAVTVNETYLCDCFDLGECLL